MARIVIKENGDLEIGGLVIRSHEIELLASTSGGPGSQHANRTLSRITATFIPAQSASLSELQRARLALTTPAVMRVSVATHRSQQKNREEALIRLGERIAAGLVVPKRRRPTKATKASSQRRLKSKRIAGSHKARRARPREDD